MMEGDITLPNSGRTEVIFDVFVTDPLVIDQYVYRCWLQGLDGMINNKENQSEKTHILTLHEQSIHTPSLLIHICQIHHKLPYKFSLI